MSLLQAAHPELPHGTRAPDPSPAPSPCSAEGGSRFWKHLGGLDPGWELREGVWKVLEQQGRAVGMQECKNLKSPACLRCALLHGGLQGPEELKKDIAVLE